MQLDTHLESAGASAISPKESPRELPDTWPNRSASRFLRVGSRRWHVQTAGSGPRMLLIHGTGASTHSWRSLLPLLTEHYQVLAIDLPGHAYSERLRDERLSLSDMTTALSELLRALDFSPEFVVGHSAGAAIGIRLVLDDAVQPSAVIGLNAALLPFGGAWQPVITPLTRLLASVDLIPRILTVAARDPSAVQRMLESTGSSIDGDGVRVYRELMQRRSHVSAVLSMMANWQLDDFLRDLPRLTCRLHLVTADEDLAVRPEQAAEICKILPAANVVRTTGGHLVHEEHPQLVSAMVNRLCREDVDGRCR